MLSVQDILMLSAAGVAQADIERISAQTDTAPASASAPSPLPQSVELPAVTPPSVQSILSDLINKP